MFNELPIPKFFVTQYTKLLRFCYERLTTVEINQRVYRPFIDIL